MNEQFVKVQVLSYIMIKDVVLAFHHLIAVKVHMQAFQIFRTLIDIADKIKILFTKFKYLF